MLSLIVWLIFVGVIAGYVARILVPEGEAMGPIGAVLLGLAGSFIGGALGALVGSGELEFGPTGVISSMVGAVIALLVYRSAIGGRTSVPPARSASSPHEEIHGDRVGRIQA